MNERKRHEEINRTLFTPLVHPVRSWKYRVDQGELVADHNALYLFSAPCTLVEVQGGPGRVGGGPQLSLPL